MPSPRVNTRLIGFVQDWLDGRETTWTWLFREAGLSPSTATGLRRGARPELSTLYALAKVMDVPPQTLFQLSGYVEAEEGGEVYKGALSPDQIALLQEFDALDLDRRRLALRLIRALRG